MRALADETRLRQFMKDLGAAAEDDGRVYFTGGATAVLMGWRASTIDADIRVVPESDAVFRAIPALKERLQLNVELASPSDFIPELPGWADRSPFIVREGRLSFHHYDFYSQVLAKVERGHTRDKADVAAMLDRGLVEAPRLRELFEAIVPRLVRYPAIDPPSFRRALDEALAAR